MTSCSWYGFTCSQYELCLRRHRVGATPTLVYYGHWNNQGIFDARRRARKFMHARSMHPRVSPSSSAPAVMVASPYKSMTQHHAAQRCTTGMREPVSSCGSAVASIAVYILLQAPYNQHSCRLCGGADYLGRGGGSYGYNHVGSAMRIRESIFQELKIMTTQAATVRTPPSMVKRNDMV